MSKIVYDSECICCEEGIEKGEESWSTADGYDAHKFCWESAADSPDVWTARQIYG